MVQKRFFGFPTLGTHIQSVILYLKTDFKRIFMFFNSIILIGIKYSAANIPNTHLKLKIPLTLQIISL